jgi:hypothetical protein
VSIGEGGGDTSSAFIRNSTVTNNTATEAGATVIRVVAPAQLAFESSTVASNATVAVRTSTKAATTAKNTIFFNNGAKSCLSPITSLGHNLDGGTSCGLGGSGDLSNTSPHLAALGSNGGPTKTMALASNSPAIDAGAQCPSVDQRGQSRPKDGNGDGVKVCDIGAYERKAVALVAVSPSPAPTASASASPSAEVTSAPTSAPTIMPTVAPTSEPPLPATPGATGTPTAQPTSPPVLDESAGSSGLGIWLLIPLAIIVGIGLIAWLRRRPHPGSA